VFTIIGAGFGLYGYLPAILNVFQSRILLVEQYRPVIESRPELNQYMGSIEWYSSISNVLSKATSAVIATPPLAQKRLVEQVILNSSIEKLIIEKPICPTPHESITLMDTMEVKSMCYRVGYTFLYTEWYQDLQSALHQSAEQLRITWSFKADHFLRGKETWKKYQSEGGGVLRFYGIHLLAVLASLGYVESKSSCLFGRFDDQPDTWISQFTGIDVPQCTVSVSTNSDENQFKIEIIEDDGDVKLVKYDDSPFAGTKHASGQDSRVPVLERLIRSIDQDDEQYTALYRATNNLWLLTEMHQDAVS